MHELQAITDAFEASQQKRETTFLATIVNTFGSTYRQKGAKMLITETGGNGRDFKWRLCRK